MVGFNPGLASLSARPPTPPKESSTKLANGKDPSLFANSSNRPLLDTPNESPSSSAENFKSSAEKAQKKVGFSPWTEFHRLPATGDKDSDSEGSLRRPPSSKECKSLKSILKTCKGNYTTQFENGLLAFDRTNLAAMLRYTIQSLTNAPPLSRLEAYSTLLASLGAYDDVPGSTDLSETVVEIAGHIRRDISAKTGSDGHSETQLETQALKVLTVFLCTPSVASLLPEDFCSFILDRCLSSIENSGSPKILVSHYMHLLEKQKFPTKLMTTDRVGKLLTVLNSVTNRVKGNRIVCHRLMIYQCLLIQARPVMAGRVGIWIDHLISGMLSSLKDVRVRAIIFGVEAGLQLGTTNSVSQSCIEVFNRASPEGTKVIDFLSSRLLEMVGSKEDGIHVPQIWSVVVLLLRGRRRQLECWEHVKAWLVVIQRCLNSSDPQVKFQANIAWSRLIFVINLDTSTSISMAKVLRQPVVSQLERKSGDKSSKQAKRVARSTYCTLLYYAFRPTAAPAQLDQYWDLYITQVLPISFAASKSDVNHASDILAALLSSDGKPRLWDENRANLNGPVKPDELPCIDPKWIRSKVANVMQIYMKLYDLADLQIEKNHEAPLLRAWRSFMTALGAASSKEVKASMDTMNAVSQIINFLKRLLERGNQQLKDRSNRQHEAEHGDLDNRCDGFKYLTQEAVAKMGSIPFLERRVVLTSHDSFEAAETPSSRSTRDPGSLNSPAIHLLNLLLMQRQIGQPPKSYVDAVKMVIQISLQTTTPNRTQLGALRNLARLLLADSIFDQQATLIFWELVAEATCLSLKSPRQSDPHNTSPQYPGQEYRKAVKILEVGIQKRSAAMIPAWHELYDCIVLALRSDTGHDGVTLLVTEPLAEVITDASSSCDECLLIAAAMLVSDSHWPQSHQQTGRTQKALLGVTHVSHKPKPDNPPVSLVSMVDALLGSAYKCPNTVATEGISKFLSSIASYVRSCPPEHRANMFSGWQPGLAAWIEDRDGRINPSNDGLRLQVDKLWEIVVTAVEGYPNHDTRLLYNMQQMLVAGFRSQRKSILNKTISMWNRTFGCAPILEYPDALREELLKLRSITNLQLPGLPELPEAEVDEVMSSPIHCGNSQDEEADVQHAPSAKLPIQSLGASPLRLIPKAPELVALSPSPRPATGLPVSVRRVGKTTPKARLRHNDSQIQFAAIESSPVASEAADSQHLTGRQKEVKERQCIEAAMFPEIRSSPKSASRHTDYSLPRLTFRTDQGLDAETAVDGQISPVYPADILVDDFLGSSPTPASTKKRSNSIQSHDASLSPPLFSTHSNFDQRVVGSHRSNKQAESPVVNQDHETGAIDEGKKWPIDLGSNAGAGKTAHNGASPKSAHKEHTSVSEVPINKSDDRILSDSDVFVDAPSEPIARTLTAGHANAVSTISNLPQINNPSQYITEDDQVTAQLVSEMERASSQQSSKQDGAKKTVREGEMKRKGSFCDTPHPHKKARSAPAFVDQQHVSSKTPQAKEFFAECVLINVRQVEGRTAASPPRIKRERSQSPCAMAYIPATKEMRVTKYRSGRTRKNTQADQTSREALSLPGRIHQRGGRSEQDTHDSPTAAGIRNSARKSASSRGTSIGSPQHPHPLALRDGDLGPELVTKTGRTRASKRWYWATEEAQDDRGRAGADTDVVSATANEAELAMGHDQPSAWEESKQPQQSFGEPMDVQEEGNDGSQSSAAIQSNNISQAESTGTGTSGDSLTAVGILQGFKKMLGNIKRIALGREEEREMIGVLFESVKEVHEAGRRHTAT